VAPLRVVTAQSTEPESEVSLSHEPKG